MTGFRKRKLAELRQLLIEFYELEGNTGNGQVCMDVLTDVLHLCEDGDVNFMEVLTEARTHFEMEREDSDATEDESEGAAGADAGVGRGEA